MERVATFEFTAPVEVKGIEDRVSVWELPADRPPLGDEPERKDYPWSNPEEVVPEVEEVEQVILSGEAPDPTRIPPGCRFHPRCPFVSSGEAARLGIEERCRTEDPLKIPACHAVA